MKQPCARDCPRRSATCAATCKEWKEYVKARNAEYEQKQREREVDDVSFSITSKNIHRKFSRRRK